MSPAIRLEKVLADFAEQYGVLTRAREQMRALSVTARSRDGVVEVTVGADGRVSGVRFVDKRFRELAGPQLADSLLEALTTARAEASARITAVMMSAKSRLAEPVLALKDSVCDAVGDSCTPVVRRWPGTLERPGSDTV
ncbi:YbaB/EbfC family nucleoid-associated protein [Streptomyces sp. NPDC001020]